MLCPATDGELCRMLSPTTDGGAVERWRMLSPTTDGGAVVLVAVWPADYVRGR